MAIPQDPHEILKERTRRVLMDNPPGPGIRSFVMGPPEERSLGSYATPAPEPEPAAVVPEPAWAMPEPEPVAAVPEQVGAAPEPVAAVPEQVAAVPEPVATVPEPAVLTPGHVAQHAEPAIMQTSETTDYMALIQMRLSAIRSAQDLHPKQVCAARRVRELSQNLAATASDSVHYRVILENLGQAHAEWLTLEEQLWKANDAIRSTQWLVDLLAEPVVRTGS